MAEIIETTGHIALSLGTFIREQLEVGFLEQPVVTLNSCWSGFYQESFAFSVYIVQQATVYLRAWESVRSFRISVPQAACCLWEQRHLCGEGTLWGVRQKITPSILASALLEGIFDAWVVITKNCTVLQYFMIIWELVSEISRSYTIIIFLTFK